MRGSQVTVFKALLCALPIILAPILSAAQGTEVAFGGLKQDTTLPVEVTADSFKVEQVKGMAEFAGNVLIGQGELRLSADTVQVEYTEGGNIQRMNANGNVVFVNGSEAAEAQTAVYTIDDGTIVMTGNVVLTQGNNAMSGQRLDIDLVSGTGVMQGRVTTIFQPGAVK